MRRLNKTMIITTHTCRVYKFYSTSVQIVTSALSVFQRNKTDTDWPFSLYCSQLDVRLAGMVSKAVVKMCRCFRTCWMTHFNNYASNWSLHVTLAVNKTLEISQVGRPSVVNKQKKWVSNAEAGHKSRNLVNVGVFFSSITIFGRTKEFAEVRRMSLMCNFGVRSRYLDVIYGVRPPNGSPGDIDDYICTFPV